MKCVEATCRPGGGGVRGCKGGERGCLRLRIYRADLMRIRVYVSVRIVHYYIGIIIRALRGAGRAERCRASPCVGALHGKGARFSRRRAGGGGEGGVRAST